MKKIYLETTRKTMKKITKRYDLVGIFLLACCFGLNFGIAAQTPRPGVIVIPAPIVSPTVSPTPTLSPTPLPLPTLPELQSKIRTILARPALMRGRVGIKVVSLDTGKVLFEDSAEKYFMPASNMKSFTVATAMDRLTPTFRFVTSVYANQMPDANGVIRGDLTIYGRGDPSFSMAFTRPDATVPAVEADYLKPLEGLADKIVQAGVKRIEGNLIGDESYFNSAGIPGTWEVDDLPGYYGAEVSALTINDNAIDVSVKPSSVGAAAIVQLMPGNSVMTVINRAVTAPIGTRRDLRLERKIGQNILEVSGSIPADDKGYLRSVAVSRPALYFVALLRKVLEQKGVKITGQTQVVNAGEKALVSTPKTTDVLSGKPTALSVPSSSPNASLNTVVNPSSTQIELTRVESPVFSLIAAKTMKPSQNLYTELILRTIGEQVGDKSDPKKSSEDKGIEVVQTFLAQAGIAQGSIVQYDGSGLSRHDLITPAAAAQLYYFMNSRPYAAAWRESLTIAGIDGTLKNRFVGTPAVSNVRGKTGTIDQVSALSGYLTTAGGERLAFSILTNGIPEGRLRTATIDEIVLQLTGFNGRSN
jgi:D-alanyl-D-alanine carboxypeptidase/D-alanyl-D-alanine-endopeptidase (penicillin-binding protein 4)